MTSKIQKKSKGLFDELRLYYEIEERNEHGCYLIWHFYELAEAIDRWKILHPENNIAEIQVRQILSFPNPENRLEHICSILRIKLNPKELDRIGEKRGLIGVEE